MDCDVLVEQVVSEVLRRLGTLPQTVQPSEKKVRALALFTGGTIGMEQSFNELRELQKQGFSFTVVLSSAAEKIIGTARVKSQLGADVSVITADLPYPGTALREAEIVLVPVLTQNTAAKLAFTQADTLCATLIMQALMMGKPVIAAQNAADPQDTGRKERTMGKASPALLAALRGNLEKISLFGIHLVSVKSLAKESQAFFAKTIKSATAIAKDKSVKEKRSVLDAKIVQEAASSGLAQISVSTGTIITPLARDVARDYGITFSHE